MNTLINYDSIFTGRRQSVLDYLSSKKYKRVIDVGASVCSWAKEFTTHTFDINDPLEAIPGVVNFKGNICDYDSWSVVLEDVKMNGPFDFAICTHTLEDIANPDLVCKMLGRIARQGFNAVPSKFMELNRQVEGPWMGYMHHRWIFNPEGKEIFAYPKLVFLEHLTVPQLPIDDRGELQWWWEGECSLSFVNGDYLGPSASHVISYYEKLFTVS